MLCKASAENYEKGFNSLKNRFGRDDLLVEYYTRELLALVLQNATNKEKKASVSEVYDKVSTHIRALETLGIATDNCATILYPLVESSLPEEILRTWQRIVTRKARTPKSNRSRRRSSLQPVLYSQQRTDVRDAYFVTRITKMPRAIKR